MTITKSILIVEDHPDMRELLGKQIEMMGFKVIVSKDGKEGLEKAVAQKPDLIMMDMMMPEMDGWEAVRALRADPRTKAVPILATTALYRSADLKACIEAGCTSYLVKPFTLSDLENKIHHLLGRYPLE
jgi:two-component system, cell cycle response regulator DivK